jgi:competence protein ComEC
VRQPAPARLLVAGGLAGVRQRPWHLGIGAVAVGLALAGARPAVVLVVAVGVLVALLALRAGHLAPIAAVLVLCAAAAGELRLAAIEVPSARVRDGDAVALRGHLLMRPRPGPFGSSAEVSVIAGRLGGARLLLRAPRWAPFPPGARIGEELRVEGRLERLSSDPADGFDTYLRARGVAAELLLDDVRRTGRARGGLPGALDRMRERADRGVVAGMPADDGALLRGMVLGQDEAIDEAVREDFRDSGLAHLLAVSGQNVMLLAALALPALMLAGLRLRARLAALVVLIALYVPLAGAGPSLQRAGVMGVAGMAAIATSRPASRSYALLLAAAGTLAWNPRAWADPGWQLSFAAVVGILVLGVPLARSLRGTGEEVLPRRAAEGAGGRRGAGTGTAGAGASRPGAAGAAARAAVRTAAVRGLADGLAITVAATLATAPLLAHHFGEVALAGLPANLLALPAVAPAMWLGMLKIALGQAGGPGLAIAEALGGLAATPTGYIASLAERCSDLPGGQLALPLDSPAAVAAAYVVLAAAGVAARAALRPVSHRLPERAARWRRLPRAKRLALAMAAALTLLALTAPVLDGPDPPAHLTVRFLDVGQGDATLIQHPDGTAVLFDGGPPEAGVTRLLRKAGVERLAVVVATHASRDHHGGLAEVIRRFPIGALLDGGDGTSDPTFRALLREAASRGVRHLEATAPLSLGLAGGALRLTVLSPPPRPPGPAPEDPNPRAVVALVSAGAFDLLLSADAESDTLLPLNLPDVDAMKVAHHGSADPGLPDLLGELDPELAAIEVGPNTYGHPAPSTLNALGRAGVATYRTDRHGTVSLTVDGAEMRVDTER